jgi:hypothetical protein
MVGLNQSFKRVFVQANNTLLASGSTYDLATGQIGIFNAETYAADATPTWAEEKAIIIAQGTPDFSDLPKGAMIQNETNKTHMIIGKKITGWKKAEYQAGQNNIVAIGYDGVDETKTMTVKCDEVKHLYVKLTGKPIEDFMPGGYLLHVEAQGPCCDSCTTDDCEFVDPTDLRDEFYTRLTEHTILGGIPLSKFVLIEKTDGVDLDSNPVVGLKFTSAFVERESDLCYFNIFPYNAEPIFIEVSEFNPDWHGTPERCASTFPFTVLQEAEYPQGAGQWLMRYEAHHKLWDFESYHDDLALRAAYGDWLNTDPSLNYDKYSLFFDFSYKVLGWSDTYIDSYVVEVFVPTGQTAFETAMNAYIASVTGLGIDAV